MSQSLRFLQIQHEREDVVDVVEILFNKVRRLSFGTIELLDNHNSPVARVPTRIWRADPFGKDHYVIFW